MQPHPRCGMIFPLSAACGCIGTDRRASASALTRLGLLGRCAAARRLLASARRHVAVLEAAAGECGPSPLS